MFKDVFISYAKEDYEAAETLYNYLIEKGYKPWLDKKNLRVGEDWDVKVR